MDEILFAKRLLEARIDCEKMLNETEGRVPEPFCQGLFDDWACWPDTPAGVTASNNCPDFVYGFDVKRNASRICQEDGSWFFHIQHNKTWSNYTSCVNSEDLEIQQMVTILYIVGYSISLVALLTSLGLLTYFKSLRCARIIVHMNLFTSFAMNNFLWVLWYMLVAVDTEVLIENGIWCRILNIFMYLFLISNYTWMLCEGFYLHTVLVSAFVSESRLLRHMLILGWGMPIVYMVPYVIFRSLDEKENEKCWIENGKYYIILQVASVKTVVLNLIFLFNILRVLCTKLRRQPAGGSGASRASLQALRATLLLVPLLGLNFLLTPIRPESDSSWKNPHEIISAITASLQGLCVAILFCFCNGEVIAQVKRKWRASGCSSFRPRANSCTVTTVSVRKFVRASYPNGEI